jgi:hypothetical protein
MVMLQTTKKYVVNVVITLAIECIMTNMQPFQHIMPHFLQVYLYPFTAKKEYTLLNYLMFPIHHQIIHVYHTNTIDAHYNTRDGIWRNSVPCGKITGQQRFSKLVARQV